MSDSKAVDLCPLLIITIDGNNVEHDFTQVTGERLVASILPREAWPEGENVPLSADIWVFKTSLTDYSSLEEHISQMKGQQITLGDLPTLSTSGQSVELELEPGNYYDVFCVGYQADGTGFLASGGRYATTYDNTKVPDLLTLDETKAFALAGIGLSIDQGQAVQATVTPMTAWSESGRIIIVGFDLGRRDENDILSNFGVMVQHDGYSSTYHGHSVQETREFLGV